MRTHPIGTGPFKFVEFKPNESVKVARNPDYWKPGRPYLDAIEYTLMPNPATAILAFGAGKFDRTGQGIMSIPLMKQLKDQAPNAECTGGTVEHPAPDVGQSQQAALRQSPNCGGRWC